MWLPSAGVVAACGPWGSTVSIIPCCNPNPGATLTSCPQDPPYQMAPFLQAPSRGRVGHCGCEGTGHQNSSALLPTTSCFPGSTVMVTASFLLQSILCMAPTWSLEELMMPDPMVPLAKTDPVIIAVKNSFEGPVSTGICQITPRWVTRPVSCPSVLQLCLAGSLAKELGLSHLPPHEASGCQGCMPASRLF